MLSCNWVLIPENFTGHLISRATNTHLIRTKAQFEIWADENKDLADGCPPRMGHVARVKLQTDNLKWLLSKLSSRKYGDRLTSGRSTTGRRLRACPYGRLRM
jgi:hypothetical protein